MLLAAGFVAPLTSGALWALEEEGTPPNSYRRRATAAGECSLRAGARPQSQPRERSPAVVALLLQLFGGVLSSSVTQRAPQVGAGEARLQNRWPEAPRGAAAGGAGTASRKAEPPPGPTPLPPPGPPPLSGAGQSTAGKVGIWGLPNRIHCFGRPQIEIVLNNWDEWYL